MLSGLILIGRGLDRKGKRAWKKKNYCLVLSVLKTLDKKNLVMIAWWTHLYPFRTQKLSIIAAKIVHCAKIARCQFLLFFLLFFIHQKRFSCMRTLLDRSYYYGMTFLVCIWLLILNILFFIVIKCKHWSIFYWLFHISSFVFQCLSSGIW